MAQLSTQNETGSKIEANYIPPVLSEEERTKEIALIHTIQRDWKRGYYATCLENSQRLPPLNQTESIQTLTSLIMLSKRLGLFARHKAQWVALLQEQVLQCLKRSPSPEALHSLAQLLFHSNTALATSAEEELYSRGGAVVPSLLTVLMQPSAPPYWNERGVLATLRLLTAFGDSRASHTLIRVAQKTLPESSDYLVIGGLRVACTSSSLVMLPLGVAALYKLAPYSAVDLILGVMGWLLGYFLLTVCLFLPLLFLMLPFAIMREYINQNRFSSMALQAIKRIEDKRMLPHLIRLAWCTPARTNQEALEALAPLLALVTPEDRSLLAFSSDEELLCNALGRYGTQMTLSILHTLEAIGGERSLQRLKRLIHRGESAEIRERANSVYTTVWTRVAQKREKTVLLRASQAPEETKDLLRPAKDSPLERQEELLHPAPSPTHIQKPHTTNTP